MRKFHSAHLGCIIFVWNEIGFEPIIIHLIRNHSNCHSFSLSICLQISLFPFKLFLHFLQKLDRQACWRFFCFSRLWITRNWSRHGISNPGRSYICRRFYSFWHFDGIFSRQNVKVIPIFASLAAAVRTNS